MSRYHDSMDDVVYSDIDGATIIKSPSLDACVEPGCDRDHHHVLSDLELMALIGMIEMLRVGDIADNIAEVWEWLHHPHHGGPAPIDLLDESDPENWNRLASLIGDQAVVELFVVVPDLGGEP